MFIISFYFFFKKIIIKLFKLESKTKLALSENTDKLEVLKIETQQVTEKSLKKMSPYREPVRSEKFDEPYKSIKYPVILKKPQPTRTIVRNNLHILSKSVKTTLPARLQVVFSCPFCAKLRKKGTCFKSDNQPEKNSKSTYWTCDTCGVTNSMLQFSNECDINFNINFRIINKK